MLVIGFGFLFFSYGTEFFEENFVGLIDDYIFSSTTITVIFVAGVLVWMGRNLFYSIRARHTEVLAETENEPVSEIEPAIEGD